MVRRYNSIAPTSMFWNFFGFAIAILSIGTSWSISQAKVYQLELAQYKLAVGNVLTEVKQVSNTLEESAQRLPITPKQKRQIQQQLQKTNAAIDQAELDIESEIQQLIEKTDESY